ncbi:MAG: GGDEF domain-containing protein [Denitratisoma sp.]|nr:GGDEF domain-containing protein [Denitratisoma sp.]
MTSGKATLVLPPLPARQHVAIGPVQAEELDRIVADGLLRTVFQPILGFHTRGYLGFEALIRGPAGSSLEAPPALFEAAARFGLTLELERACREQSLRAFAAAGLTGKLFLNVSPQCLADPVLLDGETLHLLRSLGLAPSSIVIEITENQKINDFAGVRRLLDHYRGLGYEIAIDDLGEGFSNLRLWTELHPQYIKIDRHFISGIDENALKFQMVRSIHGLAEACAANIIAEGIETAAEFTMLRDLGIAYGQGYFIAHPHAAPAAVPGAEVVQALGGRHISIFPGMQPPRAHATARTVLRHVEPVSPETLNDAVFQRLESQSDEHAVPVVKDGIPVGLINRHSLIDRFARPYRRELYGRRACSQFMDTSPLIVDHAISVQELGRLLSRSARHHMADGFIVTEDGRYIGIGYSHDLMALITEMQIRAARYANPLTQLPGNVPIDEHIARLLEGGVRFAAAYCDLDRFKPFNDVYGYRHGDDLIRILAETLLLHCDGTLDFVGHIGGDDFLVLFQSADWQARCERVIGHFEDHSCHLYSAEDLARGGILTEDRRGQQMLHALPSLSIGAVTVEPGSYHSHHEISTAAAEAKKQAKKLPGSALFVERRRPDGSAA